MIVNRHELERFHGTKSSKLVLSTLSAAVDSVRPDSLIKRAVKFSNNELTARDIYGNVARLAEFEHVYIVGAGKAASGMALAMCSILDDKVAAGAITVPYGIDHKSFYLYPPYAYQGRRIGLIELLPLGQILPDGGSCCCVYDDKCSLIDRY